MKDGKRIELELPCSVTADAEGKVILYNDTLTEDDRGLIAVSYTHLDVYKRQGTDCVCGHRTDALSDLEFSWRTQTGENAVFSMVCE